MSAEAIDLDHPGYMRHCAFPLCPAQFHALRGPVEGWRMGRGAGPLGASYFCPEHAPLVLEHVPRWLRDGPVTGTLCACGWRWVPAAQAPLGDHLLAWLLHLRPDHRHPGDRITATARKPFRYSSSDERGWEA